MWQPGVSLDISVASFLQYTERPAVCSYGMLDADEKDKSGIPLTARAVFVIGPDKRLKLSLLYPATTGRNFAEASPALSFGWYLMLHLSFNSM